MRALLEHPAFGGNKVALGRALGYSSGAYIRQMLDCERPVLESLIARVDDLRHGRFRGWFAKDHAPQSAPEPVLSIEELLQPATGEQLRALADQVRLAMIRARDRYPSARVAATLDLIDRIEAGSRQGDGAGAP